MPADTTPTTRTFSILASGTCMGEYRGANEAEALDAYATDAGYADFSALSSDHGDDVSAVELEIDFDLDGPAGPIVDFSDGATPEAIESEIPDAYGVDYTSQIKLANGLFRCPLVLR